MSSPRVVITFSAYNEARNIADVLERSRRHGTLIVVDDGSSDETVAVARACGALVVRHPMNLGQGAAVLTGLKIAVERDVDVVVEMDADGQHDPDEIPGFLRKLEETGADIVVGSRVLGSNYDSAPWVRRFFLPRLTALLNRITGYDLTDSMCGYRVFRADSLRLAIPALEQILEPQYTTAEMFVRFGRLGLKIVEVPVHLRARTSGVSHKGLLRYGWGVGRAILNVLMERKG